MVSVFVLRRGSPRWFLEVVFSWPIVPARCFIVVLMTTFLFCYPLSQALSCVIPPESEYKYTIRSTSEVTGSDGSSSMATVCGATLALLDAGVPLKAPVAGVSVGLITPPGFNKGDKVLLFLFAFVCNG